ncbi:copper-resistance protein, CopA family [Syntrophus gentianae]|uniref:Copper-resistance protein, CopA family n=2 Tax=Syntrophus gentianae TaxID=43775 RepID=A0A1H7WH94_9BACT|nr:copper resistance protein B [Syntrophus gentianae]SEM20946.1 copper-resistance protein, CopA family [Syntrophus gentianae]
MKKQFLFSMTLILAIALSHPVHAKTTEYELIIERQPFNISGKRVEKISINGSIPGPTLRFTEGDEAVIRVTNKMNEDTSIHWHGFLLPENMDGVPGFGGFQGIKPGETFTYRFKIRQNGTYWYHAHSRGQEQDGHYGSIIIHPKSKDPFQADRDYVVLLSDYTDEKSDEILSNLKMDSEYYQYARRTMIDFFSDMRKKGFSETWEDYKSWSRMRMLPTDLSDVSGYTFLVNGRTPAQNWTGLFKQGERIRLRFINASAMSFYDVRIPGMKMTVIAADGQNVEPLHVDEFRFGIAETYDVLVTPNEEKAYTIVAEPIDRTGFALATLAPLEGMRGDIPSQRTRALLTMADMGMHIEDHSGHSRNSSAHDGHVMDHISNDSAISGDADFDTGVPGSGWAEANAPAGKTVLAYKNLRFLGTQKDNRPPDREIQIRLGGNMERYSWTINGNKFSEADPIRLKFGERVKFRFINETMMGHTMHLHGMFLQLYNGQPSEVLPNKHTIIIAPGDTYSALLTADEPGEWALHCHMIYHMLAGMMTKVIVAGPATSEQESFHASPDKMIHEKHEPKHHLMEHENHETHENTPSIDHGSHNPSHVAIEDKSEQHSDHSAVTHEQGTMARKEHGGQIFHAFQLEAGAGSSDNDGTFNWHFDGWIGTDENKLWLKSEGERTGGKTEQAEFWTLYSRNIHPFWDGQVGVRHDMKPTSLTYFTLGFAGLAPYFFETEAHLFVSEDGDLSARLRMEKDFLVTQRLILQPYLEANLYAQDVPELDVGTGLASAEFGIQARYELTRKFAPYIDVKYERKFGETSSIAKSHKEDNEAFICAAGLRLMF